MHYVIVEKFKDGKVTEVYQRFGERGRLLPDGLEYVSSWVMEDLSICYEIIKTDDYNKLELWMDRWKDLIDFEVASVITSQEATIKVQAKKSGRV